MELLDLPAELLERVISELVKSTSVSRIWKLRAVCRVFDNSIAHQVLTALPRGRFNSRTASRILEANLGYFLAIRVTIARDVRPELPKKVGLMADYLYQELGATENEKWGVLLRLCQGLASLLVAEIHLSGVMEILSPGRHTSDRLAARLNFIEQDFGIEDKAISCMALGNGDLVDEILPNLADDSNFGLFGEPLRIAIVLEDLALLDSVTGILTYDRSKSRAEKKALVLGESMFNVKRALQEAISRDKIAFFRRLLDFLVTHVTRPSNSMYTDLLTLAIFRRDDPEYVRAIFATVLKDGAKKKFCAPIFVFRDACRHNATRCIDVLFKDGGLDVNSTKSERNPLYLAIRSDVEHVDTNIQAVLSAGADIDLPVYHLQKKVMLTPLQYASLRRQGSYEIPLEALDYLLSKGAALPPLSAWPLKKVVYDKYREAKHSREGVYALEWKVYKKLTDAERAAL